MSLLEVVSFELCQFVGMVLVLVDLHDVVVEGGDDVEVLRHILPHLLA
jgi:hypothetical protein